MTSETVTRRVPQGHRLSQMSSAESQRWGIGPWAASAGDPKGPSCVLSRGVRVGPCTQYVTTKHSPGCASCLKIQLFTSICKIYPPLFLSDTHCNEEKSRTLQNPCILWGETFGKNQKVTVVLLCFTVWLFFALCWDQEAWRWPRSVIEISH